MFLSPFQLILRRALARATSTFDHSALPDVIVQTSLAVSSYSTTALTVINLQSTRVMNVGSTNCCWWE